MQTPQKNTSQIIKQTLQAKKKSRQRLIGSIFLLFIALIILLSITSKIKPNNEPIRVVLKNSPSESNPIIVVGQNDFNKINTIESIQIMESTPTSTPNITVTTVVESQTHDKTIVISNNTESLNSIPPKYQAHIISRDGKKEPKPIITQEQNNKPNPMDILNDIVTTPTKAKSLTRTDSKTYIQLAAASHKENITNLQNELNGKGIHTFIQEINTPKGTMYRLRVGPFNNRIDAEHKLAELNKQGQSAIITSN